MDNEQRKEQLKGLIIRQVTRYPFITNKYVQAYPSLIKNGIINLNQSIAQLEIIHKANVKLITFRQVKDIKQRAIADSQINNDKIRTYRLDIEGFNNAELMNLMVSLESKISDPLIPRFKIATIANGITTTKSYYNITESFDEFLSAITQEQYEDSTNSEVGISSVTFEIIPYNKLGKRGFNIKNGAFMKYTNTTQLNLTRYDIYDVVDRKNYIHSCFIKCLQYYNYPRLEEVIQYHKVRNFTKRDIKKVCEHFKINIKLTTYNCNNKLEQTTEKHNDTDIYYNIALLYDHYFVYDYPGYSNMFIENYEEIVEYAKNNKLSLESLYNVNDRRLTVKNGVRFTFKESKFTGTNKGLSSLALISMLVKQGLLKPMTCEDMIGIPYNDKFKENMATNDYKLTENEEDIKFILPKDHQKRYHMKGFEFEFIIYADFETSTKRNDETNSTYHRPYMVSYQIERNTYQRPNQAELERIKSGKKPKTIDKHIYPITNIYDQDYKQLINKFLNILPGNSIIYFHNLKYDFSVLLNHMYILDFCEKDNALYEVMARRGDKLLLFRDSYKIISSKLSDFPKMFNLDCKKEILPYDYYTEERISKLSMDSVINTEDLKPYLTQDKYEELRNEQGPTVQPIKYSAFYCDQDVRILAEGLRSFRQLVLNNNQIDILDHITVSSIAETYLINTGCYEGVVKIRGVPQLFINRSIFGGRCMLANNAKAIYTEPICDLDAVSLYPSAMAQIGFAKGSPSIIDISNFNTETDLLYFIEVDILESHYNKVHTYDFPLLCDRVEGVSQYTNYPVNRNIVINNIQLHDLEKFYGWKRDIHYRITRGYIFMDGYNYKIQEVIRGMFEVRKQMKAMGDITQEVIKLLMNSSYGKTIIKASAYKTQIINKDSTYNFIKNNYHNIKYSRETEGGQSIFKLHTTLDTHYNSVHVGSVILAQSKHNMNEVFHFAHNNNIKILYQDTDSMHIFQKDYQKFEHLHGENMGQFHCDLKSSIIKDNLHSAVFIGLGKKCYYNLLCGKDKQGNIIYDKSGHIRLKGVPVDVILRKCEQMGVDPEGLFTRLYNGEPVEFDLLDSIHPKFKYNDMQVCNVENFKRNIRFK